MKMKVIFDGLATVFCSPTLSLSGQLTFSPYCNFATTGLSEIKVNSFRLTVKGSGRMRPMKTTISITRRTKTYGNGG